MDVLRVLRQGSLAGLLAISVLMSAFFFAPIAAAETLRSYRVASTYDDVRFELTNAIIERGLKVQGNGKIAAMLNRTGADVGSSKPVYKDAEYFTFCSVKLSRAMMEANPANVGHCPFVMFIYVSTQKPNEVVVGYHTHPKTGNAASIKAFADIDKLLDGIARAATQ